MAESEGSLPTFQQQQEKRSDKKLAVAEVHDEAEYEEEGWDDEGEHSSSGKRPGSTIPPPEAKKAPQPLPPGTYRNPKQAVVTSEAQVQEQQSMEEQGDEQL